MNKKCPFLGGKQFFQWVAKKGKKNNKKKKTKQTKKTNKEGLGPSEVARRATSPDP